MTILTTPCSKKPYTVGHKLTIFDRGLYILSRYAVSFSLESAEVKKNCKHYIHLHLRLYGPALDSEPLPWGTWNLQMLVKGFLF